MVFVKILREAMTAGNEGQKKRIFSVFFQYANDYIWKPKPGQGQKFKKNIIFSAEKITFFPAR